MIAAEAQLADAHAGESSRLELPKKPSARPRKRRAWPCPQRKRRYPNWIGWPHRSAVNTLTFGTPTAEPALPATVSSPHPWWRSRRRRRSLRAAGARGRASPAGDRHAGADRRGPAAGGKPDLPDMDEDLLEIFVQEGTGHPGPPDSLMARLRESSQDRELVTGLQRDLHTLRQWCAHGRPGADRRPSATPWSPLLRRSAKAGAAWTVAR